ncbi:hypothetical protein MNBD_ALPHA09-115 [hydrothermal vent metagenome]|uniref:HTH cro/C1-type domain-containing protein n=1 Tax=hydrothermal vent metagenome TaxID=652676 RepID=A0A3B0T1Z4_9ZZZZ
MRGWRKTRRFSQLSLALHCDISPRHLSFLESGRAKPSREMVLRLADCLEMPKPEINRTLLSAGFAPLYKSRPEDHADLAPVRQAIAALLENHLPFPGLALDRRWSITNANEAALKLLGEAGFGGHTNLLEALTDQAPENSAIINWEETVGLLLTRARAEMSSGGDDPILAGLVRDLETHFSRYAAGMDIDRTQAIIPTRFEIGGRTLSLFSTIAQFGTIQDLALDDLKVELMFPLDDVTKRYFQRLV